MSFFMKKPVCFTIEFHSTYVVSNRNAEIYSKRSCLKHMYVHCRPYDVFYRKSIYSYESNDTIEIRITKTYAWLYRYVY